MPGGLQTSAAGRPAPQVGLSHRTDAERRILAAASAEFATKGLHGARTHSIAEVAGVNKAMVHYYFRSKENLYREVIRDTLSHLTVRFAELLDQELPLRTLLDRIVDIEMDLCLEFPDFIRILLREWASGAARLQSVIEEFATGTLDVIGMAPKELAAELARAAPGFTKEEVFQLYVDVNAMCRMSLVSPTVGGQFWEYDFSDFDRYLQQRRTHVKAMLAAYLDSRLGVPSAVPDPI